MVLPAHIEAVDRNPVGLGMLGGCVQILGLIDASSKIRREVQHILVSWRAPQGIQEIAPSLKESGKWLGSGFSSLSHQGFPGKT